MSVRPTVHWHEGLDLLPHHFQLAHRGVEGALGAVAARTRPWAWGLIRAEMDAASLAAFKVEFTRLHAILPSGIEIDSQSNADVQSLNIDRSLETGSDGKILKLGLPRLREREPNVDSNSDSRRIRRFVRDVVDVPDENNGTDDQAISLRRLNARLLLDGDPEDGLETMPVGMLRIRASAGAVALEMMGQRIPPCLGVSASPAIKDLLEFLLARVRDNRDGLRQELRRRGTALGSDAYRSSIDQMRLCELGAAAASLSSVKHAAETTLGPHPAELYCRLRELHARLVPLSGDDSHPFDSDRHGEYQHLDCGPQFSAVVEDIVKLLEPVRRATIWEEPFTEPRINGVYAKVPSARMSGGRRWLALPEDPALMQEARDGVLQLRPPVTAKNRNVLGFDLKEQRGVPPGLKTGRAYFLLNAPNNMPATYDGLELVSGNQQTTLRDRAIFLVGEDPA